MATSGYRSPRNSGIPLAVSAYEDFKKIIMERLKELGPCILPGGRGMPQIIIGEKYTKLKTIKGEWPILRTGVVNLYSDWSQSLVQEYPEKFNQSVVTYQRSLSSQSNYKKGKYLHVGGDVVYFIGSREMNYVKIGTAKDVYQRLDGIQTSIPFDLEIMLMLPGGRNEEKKAHMAFEKYRKRGEWFVLSGSIAKYIEYMKDKNNAFLNPIEYMDMYGG